MNNKSNLKAVEPDEKVEPKTVTIEFKLREEKKGSVRYDASSDDPAVTSAYVMKKDLPKPYPQTFKMQLIFD